MKSAIFINLRAGGQSRPHMIIYGPVTADSARRNADWVGAANAGLTGIISLPRLENIDKQPLQAQRMFCRREANKFATRPCKSVVYDFYDAFLRGIRHFG